MKKKKKNGIKRPASSAALLVHLLGPTPTKLGSAFGVGPVAFVDTTDPGPVALTVHSHKIKIETSDQDEQETKRFEASARRS